MHQRVGERLPSRNAICRRIAVNIAVANCRDGSPEILMVFGIQHRDQCVVEGRHRTGSAADQDLRAGLLAEMLRYQFFATEFAPAP